MKLQLKMISRCNALLIFVKAIKEATGMGLKESKDFCDGMNAEFTRKGSSFGEIYLHGSYRDNVGVISKLKDSLNSTGGYFEFSDRLYERNMKLISLGLASDNDYADGISELLAINYYDKSVEEIESALKEVFIDIDKEQLAKIYNQLVNKFKLSDDAAKSEI